jgi:hypothetical protein
MDPWLNSPYTEFTLPAAANAKPASGNAPGLSPSGKPSGRLSDEEYQRLSMGDRIAYARRVSGATAPADRRAKAPARPR